MNRFHPVILCAVFIFILSINTFGQSVPVTNIFGRVIDAETGEPLIGANVYIANTVLGCATNENGEFIIFKVPFGTHRLVATYIGYEIYNDEIKVSGPQAEPLNIALKTDPLQSGEVVVTAERPKNWGYNLHRFKEYFIGTSANAKKCSILNPELLDFEELGTHNFRATAAGLLKIENRALGYYIELQLEEFRLINKQLHISYYPHYSNLEPENLDQIREWEIERRRAYNGSFRHFLKYLVKKCSEEEENRPGFINLDHALRYFEDRQKDFKQTYKKDDFIYRNVKILDFEEKPYSPDDKINLVMMDTQVPYEKELLFKDFLHIVYWHEPIEREYFNQAIEKSTNVMDYDPTRSPAKQQLYQTSFLEVSREPVIVNTNGVLQNPHSIFRYGYMAWESLADMVPFDYNPTPEGKDVFPVDIRPETKWFKALDEADTTKFHEEFEYPFLLVLDKTEREHYNGIGTLPGRKGFIRRYIKSRNQNPLYAVNYWFLEYIGRYEHARDEFASKEFPYFDIRGEYWIKFGKPDGRFEDPGGIKKSKALSHEVEYRSGSSNIQQGTFQPFVQIYSLQGQRIPETYYSVRTNESWNYYNDGQNFTVHFMKEGNDWIVIDRLDKALNTSGETNKIWGWMELVKERDTISNEYMTLANDIIRTENILSETVVKVQHRLSGEFELEIPGNISNGFSKTHLYGNMDVKKNNVENIELAALRKVEPNIADRFTDQNELEIDYTTAQFRGENGKTRIELTAFTPIRDLLDKRTRQDESDSISAAVQVVVRDSMFAQLALAEAEHVIGKSAAEQAGIGSVIGCCSVNAAPQTGDMTVQMQDNFSRNRGFRQQLLEIRDFTGNKPMISDIVLYAERKEDIPLPSRHIEGIDVAPYPHNELKREELVLCYFELYNMNAPGFGPMYEIELKTDSKKSRFGFIKKLFGGSGKVQISISQTRTIYDNDSKELIGIDISKLTPGEYTFTVTVKSQGQKNVLLSSERKIVIAK